MKLPTIRAKRKQTEDTIELDPGPLYPIYAGAVHGFSLQGYRTSGPLILLRDYGEFANKALCLNRKFNWAVGEDAAGNILLIPIGVPK